MEESEHHSAPARTPVDSRSLEARLLDVVHQAVIATDAGGEVIFWNAHAERLYGWSAAEALGRPIVELMTTDASREDGMAIMTRLSKGESWSGEFNVRRKDGSQFTAFVVNSPILDARGLLSGIVGVSTDISERHILNRQLQQAAKMEAIGRLAGGVAHDFNNLLTVILGHADMTMLDPGTDPGARASMEAVRAAAERAAELTRQLLAFSRQQLVSPRVLDANDAVFRLGPILRRLISADVEIQITTAPDALWILVDPTQLDQVIMNLAVNARDAMPSGGTLHLQLESVAHVGRDAPADRTGRWLRVRVTDTGVGMSPETLQHVFEPFFTTKGLDQGTGLGLSTVFGIVSQAGGTVHVDSVPEAGTTFSILLPLTTTPVATSTEPVQAHTPADASGRTILLVEDEPALRTLTTRILGAAGFSVLPAECAEHALRIAAAHDGHIDLLLTDVVMPGQSGVALSDQLQTVRPELRVVLMTGYTEEDVARRSPDAAQRPLVRKPFVGGELLAAVHAALDAPSSAPSTA